MRKEVQKYIKKKYMAADGGEVPDDDSADETEETVADASEEPSEGNAEAEESPENSAPDAPDDVENENEPAGDEVAPPAAAGSSASARDPQVLKDYLAQKYAAAADDSGVKDAVAKKRRGDMFLAIGEGLEGALRAKGQAAGGQGVNHQSYQDVSQHFNDNIKLAESERQQAIQGVIRDQALQEHMLSVKLKQGTLEERQRAAKMKEAKDTPGTPTNVAAAELYNKAYPDLAVDPKTSTPASLQTAYHIANSKEHNSTLKDLAAAKQASVTAGREKNASDKADKASDKASQAQEKDYTEFRGKMDGSGRGIGTNVKNAFVAKTNIANAKKIIEEAGGPDNLNDNQVHLFMGEIAKLATGGAPTEGTMNHLNPDTFQQRYNAFMGKVKGSPNSAEVGDFIRANQQYLGGLEQVSDAVINKHQENTYKSYRRRLAPDQLAEAETDWPLVSGKKPDGAAQPTPPPGASAATPVAAAPAAPPPPDLAHPQVILDAVAQERARRKALKGGTAIGSK